MLPEEHLPHQLADWIWIFPFSHSSPPPQKKKNAKPSPPSFAAMEEARKSSLSRRGESWCCAALYQNWTSSSHDVHDKKDTQRLWHNPCWVSKRHKVEHKAQDDHSFLWADRKKVENPRYNGEAKDETSYKGGFRKVDKWIQIAENPKDGRLKASSISGLEVGFLSSINSCKLRIAVCHGPLLFDILLWI